jgi:predicted CopG family antitoxin
MHECCVPTITVTLSTEAHRRLKKLKQGNESFSDVILRELPERAYTCGELLDIMGREFEGIKLTDPSAMQVVETGRKRRSNVRNRRVCFLAGE